MLILTPIMYSHQNIFITEQTSCFQEYHHIQISIFEAEIQFSINITNIMSSSILRYGQVIRIRSYQKPNTFLSSKSYTDPNLYFQIYNKHKTFPFSDILNISNYRQSLFEVLPTSSFQINDQMNSQKIQAKKAESAPRAKTEEQQFKAIIAEKRGKNISFGDRVVFRHVDSHYYIYGSFDCATSGIGAFKIELKKQLSEKIIFQLMAYRTYEKEGDEMSIFAPFEIYHCQTQCYLSYCYQQLFLDKVHKGMEEDEKGRGKEEGQEIQKGKLGQQDPQFPVDPPKIKQFFKVKDDEQVGEDQISGTNRLGNNEQVMLKTGRYLIINENIPKRVFKLVTHNQFEMKVNRQKIRNHDIVYFIHTQDDQYIVPYNFGPFIFLKKRIDEPDQTDIFDGLWEIEEIKTLDEKPDDPNMARSKTPSRKENAKQPKKYGNQLNPSSNLNATYLKATVGNPIVEGQLRPGFTPSDQEDEEQKKSGKTKFILRHLASGRIMHISQAQKIVTLDPRTNDPKETPIFLLLEAVDTKLEDGSLVKFTFKKRINASDTMKLELSKKSKIIKKNETIQQFSSEDKIHEAANQQSRIIQQQDSQSNPLFNAYDSRFQIDNLQLVPQSSEHGFRIYKINQEVKQLCLFVLSSQEIISKFTSLIDSYETLDDLQKQLTVFLLNNVANVFKSLIGFIYDCDYNKIAESGNNPIAKRQRIFDEVGMIELTTRMLQIIHKRDFQQSEFLHELEKQNKISEYKKIRNIYQLGYKLLESIAAGNDLLKVKISRYNNKYLYQIIRKENRIVYRSIQQVLEGNQLALEDITQGFIQKLIQNLDQNDPDPADLYFLSRLCLCRERTVHKNQIAVFEKFYKQKNLDIKDGTSRFKVQQKLAANKFKFRQDQQKMQILSIIVPPAEPQYRTLSQLFEECNLMKSQGGYNPDKNHWAYFMQYLNLLADLCVQRNPFPLKYIQLNLPLKTLVAFLHETTVKKNLLFQPFIRLVHHAFVENSDYEEISRITKVKDWQKLNNFQIPKAQKQIPEQLKKTMNLIFDYIKRINKKPFQVKKMIVQSQVLEEDSTQGQPEAIELDVDDKNRLINVKTFLQILKSTLNLGFWPEIEKMKMIIPYLLKILRFDIEYSDRAVERQIQQDKKNNYFRFAQEFEYKDYVYSLVKQQLKLNKPNIVLLVECKILAARILNIIIDYEFNARVSLITKHFKDVMEVDTDLSKYTLDKIEFIKKWNKHQQYDLFAPQNKKEGYLLIEQIWMDKVDQILSSRDLFSECQVQNINPSLVFFQAFIYSNQELTNLTLNLINRITNQKQEILKTFKDIIFVAGGVLSVLAIKGVESTRSILLNLANPTIKESQASNIDVLWRPINQNEMNQNMKPGVIQQLASLTVSMIKTGDAKLSLMSEDKRKDIYNDTNLFPFFRFLHIPVQNLVTKRQEISVDGSFMIITQKDINLPLNQNLIKSQDHHLIIVKFLQNMKDIPWKFPLATRALHASYNFLTVLIWNNNQNKKQLEPLLKLAEVHLQDNVGCIDFFKQMYTNNKKLVKGGNIKPVLEQVIKYANQTRIQLYQKSKLLDFLRIAVIFDNEGYDINQNLVMELISQFQVSDNNQIVYLPQEQGNVKTISYKIQRGYETWMKAYLQSYQESIKEMTELDVPAQLMYVATFFEIFSALIENENVVNIGKASNMHPIEFLYRVMYRSNKCWIVIRHLRSYLNKLYYFQNRVRDTKLFQYFIVAKSERLNQFGTHDWINDLLLIKTQLQNIAELICNTPEYNFIKIKKPVRYSYMGSYVYLALQEILHSLDLFFKETEQNKLFFSYLAGVLTPSPSSTIPQDTTYTIIEIIEYLEYLLKTIDGRYISKYMSRVSKRLKNFVSNIPMKEAQAYSDRSKQIIAKNIADNALSSDEIPFKKAYQFHQGKGFWRHLIDWNSFKEQEVQRERELNKVSKRIESLPNQTPEAFANRRRDYLMDVIFLGNIDKRLQKQNKKIEADKKEDDDEKKKKDSNTTKKAQSSLPKNLTTSQSNRFDVKKQKFASLDQKNIVINNRRKKLVKFLQINPLFKEYSQSEVVQNLYDVFADLRQISAQRYGFKVEDKLQVVGCEEVIQSIVKMNQVDSNSIKYEYKLLIIRLLINYIQRTSDIFKNDIKYWAVNEEQKKKINKAQNFLHQCGVASFLSSLIINDLKLSIQMGNAILMLGITLLMGSSKQIQRELFQLIMKDQNNLLLSQISILIKDCGSSIAMLNVRGEAKEFTSRTISYSDTYDFYIDTEKIMKRQFVYQPETVLEQKEFDQKVVNMQYAFIFLKNLCQSKNQIKNYIHEQILPEQDNKLKPQSVDFLNLSIVQLKRMFNNFNISIIKVPFSIIDFIYEVTQIPCLKNQVFICKSTLFSDFAQLEQQISSMIKQKYSGNQNQLQKIQFVDDLATIFELYSANIKNVISCLEGNIQQIYESLSQDILCRYFVKVLAFYRDYLPKLVGCEQIKSRDYLAKLLNQTQLHEKYYMDMFQATSVIVKLQKKTVNIERFRERINLHLKNNDMQEIFSLLRQNLLGIQIKGEQSSLVKDPYQTLFFPKHNVFRYISRSTRTNVMEQVDRSTQRDKIIGLFSYKELITQEIEYNYHLDNQYKLFNIPLAITTQKVQTYMSRGLSMAVIICLLMLYFASVVYYPYSQTIEYDLGREEIILKIASIIQFIIAMTYFFLWIKSHLKLAVQKYERMKANAQQGEQVESKIMTLLFKIPGCKNLYCLKEDGQFGTMMLFMFGSLMGMFYKIEWYSLLLMNLLMARLDVLKNIIRALKVSLKMLGILSVFGVSFITFFSVFSMSYYAQSIYPDKYPDQHCERVYECVIQLYINQQIGQDMQVFKPGRFVYDMIYVVFMDMLFGNILGGVLIDNFASLRSEREDMLKDKTQKCFICGIDREALQKKSEDLKTHYTKQYHKLWNYVFYLYYLEKQTKRTGIQTQILRKSNSEDVSWIPVATEAQNSVGDLLAKLEQLIKEQKLSISAVASKQ